MGGTEHAEREGIDSKLLEVKYTKELGALGFRDTSDIFLFVYIIPGHKAKY